MQTITIFGSTGSIGTTTLEVLKQNPNLYKISGLIGNNNADLLIQQAKEFRPEYIVIVNESEYKKCKEALEHLNIKVWSGKNILNEIAQQQVDCAVMGISGIAALHPTLIIARNSKILALANKESIVCGGHLLKSTAQKSGCKILPLDSEHVALWQLLQHQDMKQIKNLVITASGGPFLKLSRQEMQYILPENAIKHPNWQMGKRISIDSATLFNKGLEILETYFFFDIQYGQVQAIVHPQSIVHGIINFIDNSSIAQINLPDMKFAISYILGQSTRLPNNLSVFQLGTLEFFQPDLVQFPLLELMSSKMMYENPAKRIAANSADEFAVNKFLAQEINFLDIEKIIFESLNFCDHYSVKSINSVEAIYELHFNILQYLNTKSYKK